MTFHQRMPPTWLCAPGPTPHQSPPRPVQQVVPAAGAVVRRPVGDLVPVQPGGAEHRVGERGSGRPCASSSGAVSSPRRTWAASRVPSSTISAYAETWSGPASSAASRRRPPVVVALARRAVDEVEADVLEPGLARPATPAAARPGVCVRSRTASTCGAALCIPKEMRVKPASRSAASVGRVDRSRGWPRSSPRRRPPARTRSPIASRIRPRSSAGSSVGVPPPKNTVSTGRPRRRAPAGRAGSPRRPCSA